MGNSSFVLQGFSDATVDDATLDLALEYAATAGHHELVKHLLTQHTGAGLEDAASNALYYAVTNGHADTVAVLLEVSHVLGVH